MKKKRYLFLLLSVLYLLSGCSKTPDINIQENVRQPRELEMGSNDCPVFCQFYDWFEENAWVEDEFVDPILWEEIGIEDGDRSSVEFYEKQFTYMRSLGIDSISWEFHPRFGVESCYPSENAIAALKNTGMKVAPFFDYEIAIKARTQDMSEMVATLSSDGAIRPDEATVVFIADCLKDFYDHVPTELLAEDVLGRKVIFVFGYDFNDENPDPEKYQSFGESLIATIGALYGDQGNGPVFYWSCKNSVFIEYLFQHFKDNFEPFQFVLDTPQSQYGHDSVT